MIWSEFKALTEDSLMPFGKHRGKPMREVPRVYLWRLWSNGIVKPHSALWDYVWRHRGSITEAGERLRSRRIRVFWCCGGPFGEDEDCESDDMLGMPGDPFDYGDN